jgi:hypothetical protein
LINTDVKKRLAKGYKDILKQPSMNISINLDQVKVKQAAGLINLGDHGEIDSIRQIVSKYNSANKESRQLTTTTEYPKKNNYSRDSYQSLADFQPARIPEIKDSIKAARLNHGFFSKSRAEMNYNSAEATNIFNSSAATKMPTKFSSPPNTDLLSDNLISTHPTDPPKTPNPDPNSHTKNTKNSIDKINQILARNHKIISNIDLVSL